MKKIAAFVMPLLLLCYFVLASENIATLQRWRHR